MQLALSSAAAPDLPLADLLEGCARRGLAALELVLDGSSAWIPGDSPEAVDEVARAAESAGIRLAALVVPPGELPSDGALRLAVRLGAPVLLRLGELPFPSLIGLAERQARVGGRTLLLHGTDPARAERLRAALRAFTPEAAGLAWEIDPATDDPALLPALLAAAGPALEYVRLRGGGPEAMQQTGLGVGAAMARLALARYGGPLVLTPSTPRYAVAWRAWLGRGGGWGCGSKQSDPSLVALPLARAP